MSTVKISQLPEIDHLNTNTDDTLVVGVDTQTGVTGKITATTLAEGLYSNNVLKVGENHFIAENVIAQFSGNSALFLQTLVQNFDANGSADMVAMTSDSDNFTRFVDLGINGSRFADPAYSSMKPYDAYLFSIGQQYQSQTGNLVIGTGSTDAEIVFIAGGTEAANIVGRISKTSLDFYGNMVATGTIKTEGNYIFSDLSTQSVAAAPANYTQSAFNAANNAIANTIINQGVDLTQNTQITQVNQYAASGFAQANTNSTAITQLQNINTTQNTNILAVNGYAFSAYALANTNANNIVLVNQFAGGAYAKANAALANATGTFAGDLTVTGNVSARSITNSGNTSLLSYVNIVKSNAAEDTPLVQITSNESGSYFPSSNIHYILQLTGKANGATRFVMDSFGANSYPVIVGRMARGTVTTPLATANNDVMMRIVGNGYTGTQFTASSPAKIDFVASENYSDTNKGSIIQFWNTPRGSNTIQKIATFNADSVEFTGSVIPEKGFVYTPRLLTGPQTAITVDFSNDAIIKASLDNNLTVSFANYTYGKIVEVWLTNTGGTTRTVTHGCSATNSSDNATTFTIPATSSAYLRYFSLDGDLANTFVTSVHA
jgi:hypothetical protein